MWGLKSLSISPSVHPSNHPSIHLSICLPTHPPTHPPTIYPSIHPPADSLALYSFLDSVNNTEHSVFGQTHHTLSSIGARSISYCWHCNCPQGLTHHQWQITSCQMNEKDTYATCLTRKQSGEWFCFTLVLFPNFLAVVRILLLNKCLLKEGRSLCVAAVVWVHGSWPYACVPCSWAVWCSEEGMMSLEMGGAKFASFLCF